MACLAPPVLPTPPQERALSALTPLQLPAPPSLSQLTPLLTFLQPEWVRNFFFTKEPIHLAHLSSPFTPFVASMSATRIDPQRYDSHHLNNRYVFTPAFTTPPYTAGFGVMHCQLHMPVEGAWKHCCTQMFPFRFVRNADLFTTVEVMHVEEHDAILIFLSRLESTTTTRALTMLCTRSRLLQALENSVNLPNPDKLQPAINFLQHEVQRHNCKICNSSSDCFCILPVDKPKHPFDTDFFQRSMQLHLGEFQSVCNKMQWIGLQGKPEVRHIVMGSRVMLQGISDASWAREMADIVVRQERGNALINLVIEPALSVAETPSLEDVDWILDLSGSSGSTGVSQGGGWWDKPCEEGEGEKEEEEKGNDNGEGEKEKEEEEEKESEKEKSDEEEKKKVEERRRRARERRERNRIAARKSNLKRKLFVDGLTSDVEKVRRKVETLREREVKLREENLLLRKLIREAKRNARRGKG